MKSFLLLTGTVCGFHLGLAHGTDIPSDVMRGHILPRLENADLFNYGSTDKSDAAVVQQYKKDNRIVPKAKFSLPSAQKVLAALTTMPNPQDTTIKIGNTEWEIKGIRKDVETPGNLQSIRRASLVFTTLHGQENIGCNYAYGKEVHGQEVLLKLVRALQPSQSKINFQACSIVNPGFEQKLEMKPYGQTYLKSLKDINVPPDQDLDLICDQVPKEE